MILKETVTVNGKTYVRRYSDNEDMMLRKLGTDEMYIEAVDLVNSGYAYEEVRRTENELNI